jgi:hypothetical protein
VVAASVGLGFGLSAEKNYERYKTTRNRDEYNTLRKSISHEALTANIMFGVASTALVSAVVSFLLDYYKE